MEIVKIYNEFVEFNKDYCIYVKNIAEGDILSLNYESTLKELTRMADKFEDLMNIVSKLEVEEEQKENLNDLKYLVMDAIFASRDFEAFFKAKQVERFKMRIMNYENKKQRSEMFSDVQGNCRVNK